MDNKYDIALHEEMICNKAKAEGREEGMTKGLEEGLKEGRAEGEAKGRADSKLEIARAMKAKGLDASMIVECTGLTEDQIKQL